MRKNSLLVVSLFSQRSEKSEVWLCFSRCRRVSGTCSIGADSKALEKQWSLSGIACSLFIKSDHNNPLEDYQSPSQPTQARNRVAQHKAQMNMALLLSRSTWASSVKNRYV